LTAGDENNPAIKTDWVYVSIISPPKSVTLVSNNKQDADSIVLVKNQTTIVECIAEESNPACMFTWFLDSSELKTGGEVTAITATSVKKNKVFKTTGKISIKPLVSSDWQSKSLKCECGNQANISDTSQLSSSKSVSVNCKLRFTCVS
jgi:hypothetical protein